MNSYDIDRGYSGILTEVFKEKINEYLVNNRKVRLKHYSVSEYIITEVDEVSEYGFKIKITNEIIRSNILNDDRVLISFVDDNHEYLIHGIVEHQQTSFPQFLDVRVTRLEVFEDKRKSRRYAFDAYGNFVDDGREYVVIVKNVSLTGFRIFTKAALEDGKNLQIKVFIDEDRVILVNVGIVRKKQLLNYYEYGLVILKENEQMVKKELDNLVRSLELKEI